MIDPLTLAEAVEKVVSRRESGVVLRKYWRFRGGRWYGGIATADAVGCNLRCAFCWSWQARDRAASIGKFYSPEEVWEQLERICERRGYRQVRVSGCEPTIAFDHLLQLLDLVEASGRYLFILETNGILLGARREYAEELGKYSCVHVRVSIKGCTPEEFSKLTMAKPEAFELQLKALENLLDAGVSCHAAVMASFSTKASFRELLSRLAEIDPVLAANVEEEYVILYPHVAEQLRKRGLWPRVAYKP